MLKLLIILLITIYIWSILDKITKFIKITSCIDTLSAFLKSTQPSTYTNSLVGDDYKDKLYDVLAKYPDICDFTSFYSATLEYGQSDYKNYVASNSLYNELYMARNFLRKEVFNCLNPLTAVKTLVSFPSSAFKLLGFEIKPSFAKFFNLLGWIITYFLTMYMDEIKSLINSLLKLH